MTSSARLKCKYMADKCVQSHYFVQRAKKHLLARALHVFCFRCLSFILADFSLSIKNNDYCKMHKNSAFD